MKKIYQGHPDQRFGPSTYAQHGDDLLLLNVFQNLGIEKPSYLDIGAHHPETISNTKLLYDRGSRGVNVEANPALIHEFYTQRLEDQNICIAIGLEDGEASLFMYSETSGRNTVDPKEVEKMKGVMTVRKQITVPVITINSLLNKFCGGVWPDLLSVDIEGLDYGVLESMLYTPDNKPKVICVETRIEDTDKMVDLMLDKGYALLFRCSENLIFVDLRLYPKAITGNEV